MNKKPTRVVVIAILLVAIFAIPTFSIVFSSPLFLTQYPQSPIEPTLYLQGETNWCGPGSMQSSIQWITQYNDGDPVSTVVPVIPKSTLWAYMRDNTCSEIGPGHDSALPGIVGDEWTDIRRMNIAYDFGVDPHAMAWTMWEKTPSNHYYHYWIYYDSADEATQSFLYTLERYHEPVLAAVNNGSHWVDVIGYEADSPAYPGPSWNITSIQIADPLTAQKQWISYSDWTNNWFTPYTDTRDPDPATGWYTPPPDHWLNHWVTIERDLR